MKSLRNAYLLGIFIGLTLLGMACTSAAQTPAATDVPPTVTPVSVVTQEPIAKWEDQYGHANDAKPESPRIVDYMWDYIVKNFPNATLTDHGDWWQAAIPLEHETLYVSWAEFAGKHDLGDISGVVEGKYVAVAMQDYDAWVDTTSVQHLKCVASYLQYKPTMSNWVVDNSTIFQFDGSAQASLDFMTKFAADWAGVREKWEGCYLDE